MGLPHSPPNMPFAQIDDEGISICYQDTGAPDGSSTYTTLVCTHGAMINSSMWDRMGPYASKYGLRMISLNERDYAGSSPHTKEELAQITSPDGEVQAHAVRRSGLEMAQFLAYVCRALNVPVISGEGAKKQGGLVLVAWSASGIAALSMLGDPRTMGSDLTATLAPYLRKVILHDPPSVVFGETPDLGIPWPVTDPTIPPERIPDAIIDWVSSSFSPVPEGVPITAESLREHHAVLPGTPTLRALSPEDYKRIVEPGFSGRGLGLILMTNEAIHRAHAHRTFSDADAVLPGVDILCLYCDHTPWTSTWGAKMFQDLASEAADPGKKKRKTAFLRLQNANHFVSPLYSVGPSLLIHV
ncbi:uncharacterized protein PHACADRAFT_138618 [Phanerochaete carnosa HHB-10118-sp]|uniref:AB hydrolase-1 domain-containing protein n=1 Tax=Phanerochaete carnosa (strain HHB-10118-sp) TaxID=650164 RepID=K5X3Q9_PHACS|nr:uncharacterized protein PHACADRAFT_138618 [Phanerochaete carnosa HHB-10118-sp]EKM57442.1 hypothetical protein PHACADRAFT_138618 [Phanerochaete carnosa HHB-10118-sp]